MKVSREQAAANHDRIVDTAAQLFRERGFERIQVDHNEVDRLRANAREIGVIYTFSRK